MSCQFMEFLVCIFPGNWPAIQILYHSSSSGGTGRVVKLHLLNFTSRSKRKRNAAERSLASLQGNVGTKTTYKLHLMLQGNLGTKVCSMTALNSSLFIIGIILMKNCNH